MRVLFKRNLLFILKRKWPVQLFPSFHVEKTSIQLELYSSSSQVQEYPFDSLNPLIIDYKCSGISGLVEKGKKKDTSESQYCKHFFMLPYDQMAVMSINK